MMSHQLLLDDIDRCPVPPGRCAFWWLGQHSFVIKLADVICYIDPFLTALADRQVPPLLRPDELAHAAWVLGSHDHADHIDRDAWPAIAEACPRVQFVVPRLLRQRIVAELGLAEDRVLGIDDGIVIESGGLRIEAVPAAHEFLDVDPQTGLHPYVGFIVQGGGFTVYHAGDTCVYEGMQASLRRWKIDLALLPINGRDAVRLAAGCIGNMTYQEAADLAGCIQPRLTVPAHFDMFAMNSEDPQRFVDYMKVKYPHLPAIVPQYGQRVVVDGSSPG